MRVKSGPAFLECRTYRIEPHCGIIPDEREPGERESWHERDPILILRRKLEADGSVQPKDVEAVEAQVNSGRYAAGFMAYEAAPAFDPLLSA